MLGRKVEPESSTAKEDEPEVSYTNKKPKKVMQTFLLEI
jgi:hypothetical protein